MRVQPWTILGGIDPVEIVNLCIAQNIPYDSGDYGVSVPTDQVDNVCLFGGYQQVGRSGVAQEGFMVVQLRHSVGNPDLDHLVPEARVRDRETRTACERYVDFATGRYGEVRGQFEKQRNKLVSSEAEQRGKLLQTMQELEAVSAEINKLDENGYGNIARADLEDEFHAIVDSPKVARVFFDDQRHELVVMTKYLFHREAGRLGEFELRIQLDAGRVAQRNGHYDTTFTTIKQITGNQRHPHSGYEGQSSDGYCLGTAAPELVKAMKSFNLQLVVDILIRFLEEG